MAIDIAKLAILLTGNVDGLASALKQGEKGLSSFDKVAESFSEGLGIGAGIDFVEKGVEVATEAIHKLVEAFEAVGNIGRQAVREGMSPENFSRLAFAADATHTDIEGLTSGIQKMLQAIEKSDEGDEKLTEMFAKLHLNTQLLKSEDPADAFQEVATAIGSMNNAAERALAVKEIFGKGGAELLPLIKDGAKQLNELMGESDQLGFTRTKEDIEAVEMAEQKLSIATDALKARFMDLAAQAAPALSALAEGATALLGKLTVDERLDRIKNSLTELRTTVKEDETGVRFSNTDQEAYEAMNKLVKDRVALEKELRVQHNTLLEKSNNGQMQVDDYQQLVNVTTQLKDAIHQRMDAEAQFADMNPAETETKAQEKLNDEIEKGLDLLRFDVAMIGATKGEMEQYKLALKGATEEQQMEAKALRDRLELAKTEEEAVKKAAETQKKAIEDLVREQEKKDKQLMDEGKRVTEETRTEQEKLNEALEKNNELYDDGAISLDTYARANDQARQRFSPHEQLVDSQVSSLIEAGSQAAASLIVSSSNDPMYQVAKESRDHLKSIDDNINNSPIVRVRNMN